VNEKIVDKPGVLRETDDEARRLARVLVRGARHMALAVIDAETGFPSASRALTATDLDGIPVILASGLSAHTKALLADPRCSLLAGEPRKGDPLAHARITVQCLAEPVDRTSDTHAPLRERFLDRHPKAALYIDFPDFRFFRLTPRSASLNGGFGRAYSLSGDDFVIPSPAEPVEWRNLQSKMRDLGALAVALAERLSSDKVKTCRFAGVDPAGFDLVWGDNQLRHEFTRSIRAADNAFKYIVDLSNSGTVEHSLPQN
jgi:putative heme iron utilization protein